MSKPSVPPYDGAQNDELLKKFPISFWEPFFLAIFLAFVVLVIVNGLFHLAIGLSAWVSALVAIVFLSVTLAIWTRKIYFLASWNQTRDRELKKIENTNLYFFPGLLDLAARLASEQGNEVAQTSAQRIAKLVLDYVLAGAYDDRMLHHNTHFDILRAEVVRRYAKNELKSDNALHANLIRFFITDPHLREVLAQAAKAK